MGKLALALGGLTAAWVVAPVVAMTTRGTIDQRTRAAWRATPAVVPPVPVIPAQRRGGTTERLPA
jgi:hypothetical protein